MLLRVNRLSLSGILRTSNITRSISSNVKILGDDNSFTKVHDSLGKKVYYFTASWCPPCKMIAPKFDKLSIEYPNIAFIKIDVDQLADTAQNYRIQSVPTFMFFKDQKKMAEFPGADEGNLKKQLINLESL